MADSIFDPLSGTNRTSSPMVTFGESAVAARTGYPYMSAQVPQPGPFDLSGRTKVRFVEPEDATAVRFGSTADPMQLDMDPFGRNTVEWGKVHGAEKPADYVLSANVFGHVMSRKRLEQSEKGRRLMALMEDVRNGRRRDFWDAITDWSVTDLPFFGMFATVGRSINDAMTVHRALDKMQKGEPVTEDEALTTRLYMAEQEKQGQGTWGATVGDIVRAAPGFMAEFSLSGWALGGIRAAIGKSASKSAETAARLSLDRFTKYTARGLVEEGFAKAIAGSSGSTTEAALRTGWQSVDSAMRKTVRDNAVRALTPMVKEQLGSTAEMAEKIAGARADIEIARALARNSPKSGVVRWLNGTAQAALDHVSRGLLDFGHYGTDVYSATGKELGSAMKTLGHAIGALGPEALVRGSLVGLPQAAVVKPLVGLASGGKVVSPQQLSLEAQAVRTGNRDLFNSAESYAAGLNLAEYVSESAGRGFGLAFRSAGLGLFGAKAMGAAAGSMGLLPKGVAEEAGSAVRRWIAKAVGSTDDMVRGHLAAEVKAVSRKLHGRVSDDVVETFVRTGNVSVLGEAAAEVGTKPREFIAKAVKETITSDRLALSYRTFWRYALADKMLRMGWGPDQMTRWLRHAGYDGIVEEMMEERYNDFAKGLFGLDDRAAKDKGFFKNIRQAFDNLKPGWEQLTAEAVGFAVPLGARVAVNSIHRAAGGSDLSYIQRYASTVREFRGANNIVEMRQEDYFRVAEEEIGRLRSRLTGKDANGNQLMDSEGKPIESLEKQIADREAELKAEGATPETIERETAELREEMKGLQNRISVAEDQVRKQRTVDGAGQRNAESILAFEATNTTGERTGGDVPTSQQAKRGVTAKDAIVEGAARAGEILARAKADAVDPKTMPLGSRIVHRITNVLGAIVTGDLAMAMEDPMAWSMVDRGMDRTIVGRLAEAYNSHFDAAKARLMREGKASPSSDEVREAMREGYEAEARSIAQSWLAAQGIRIFSAREMLEQARGVVMDRHGTLDGHEDEVDQVRDQIAERTLRILSGGALQSADVGRIARGIISISDDSPFLNDKITDAALRLSGFRGLEQVVELRPETDLRSAIGARSVDGKLVSDIAKMDLSALKDGEQEILQRVAAQLGYTPNHDAAGKNTMAFTEEAIARMNQRVHRLCRLAMASASPYIRTYRKAADEAEFGAPGRAGSGDFIRVVQDGRGFHWTETVPETGAKVSRTAATEADLEASMERMGFERTPAPVTFVLAREIRTKDPAVMLTQLGLDREYVAKMTAGKERDALAVDNNLVHPALRERVNSDGVPERIPYEEAQRIFRDELSKALRFREVMSLSEGERLAAFRESAGETDAQVLFRLNEAEYYYKSVFGSEQGQEGYLPVLEKMLRAAGVEMPGAGNRSYSRYLAGQDGYYTLNTRLLNFHEGQAFVLVDLDRDVDYDGAILSRAISNGLVAFRDLWAYDGRTKTYPAFSTVVRDMARRLDRVAVDLARESIAAGRPGEARAMMALLDRIMGGSNVDRPKVEAIVWLIRNAVFGQAMREAKASRSTTADVAAEARLAQALRQTQEFWPFLGFSDLILGGNGFAGAARQKGADTFGVARLAAAFSGNPNYLVEDLLKGGLLPVDRDGRRMPVQDFMDLVNRTLAARSKSVDQTARDRAAQAADRDVMEFIGELRKVAGLNTYEDLRNFMEEVLRQSGIRAGNTEDLRKWRSAVEHSRVYREALEAEVADLQRQIDGLEAEVERLRNEGAESKDRIEDLLAQIDVLKARRNAQEGTREPAVPGSDEASDEVAETGTPAAEDAPGTDEDERPSPSLDETPDTWDPDSGLGADGYDISGSYEVPPSAGDTVRTDSKDADGNTATGEVELPDPVSMTPEARRHAMWTAVAAMRAKGPAATVDSFMATLRDLFPGMSDADAAETMAEFSARADEASRRARAEDETVLDLVAQELNDDGSDIKDYDGWNDKAVQAYNSLAPMLEMMEAALPLAKRNFQGLVGYLRTDVARRLRDFQETDQSSTAKAYRMMDEMLSPRRSMQGKTYAERLAYHRSVLSRLFDSDRSDETLGALIAAFTAKTTVVPGTKLKRMENAPLAAFVSFLASLHTAGTRQSIALLFSSSTACSAVSVGNVVRTYTRETAGDSYDPSREGTTFRSSDLQVNSSVTTRGSISVAMAAEPFIPLAGMKRGELESVGQTLKRLAEGAVPTMAPMAFSGEKAGVDYGFTYENVGGDSLTGEGSVRVYTDAPRGILLQDIETFRRNAETVAGVLDRVLGRGNSLSRVLTSTMLFNRMRARALRSDDFRGLVQMRNFMEQFAPDAKGHIRALDVVRSILLRLYNESSATTGVDRDRLAWIVQTAFVTGDLEQASLAFPSTGADTPNSWVYLMDEAVQSMPDTVVPAKKVQYRTTKDSSVAVAAPGMIPIVVRYMTAQDGTADSAFRTLCESIVREDAVRAYWRDAGVSIGAYINPNDPASWLKRAGTDPVRATELIAGAKDAAERRLAELGGIDAVVDSCLDTMTWPDEAHTPMVARNLSVDYSPAELGRACAYTYSYGAGLWYIPLFGGDHSCNNLLQVPAVRIGGKDLATAYLKAARAVNDSLGVSMMMADTKRSAITSADAAAVPMVGCEVEWTDEAIPSARSVKFGEARHHLIVNLAEDGGEEYSQEAAHGQTMYSGFGAEALRNSAKDPTLRISKFHALGTGFWLDFRKSAVTLVSDSWLADGGADAPGTMTRAMGDYILGYRSPEARRSSSDQVTDEDSYKVGPLKSAIYQVATGDTDADGHVPGTTILAYVKKLLKGGMEPKRILEQEVRMVDRSKGMKGELSGPMKLSEVLEGFDIQEVKGFHQGDSESPVAFAMSYRDNSMLALKVANIAHRAKPHLGTNGKNYTIDATAKAVEQTIRKGVKLSDPEATTQNQVITTLNAWAILGSAVATDPVSVERELEDDPRLQTLKANGADPRGLEYRKLRAETVAKRIRKSMLSPLNKIEATLTTCGATLSKTGKLLDHTVCPMRRDVHGGSVVFGAEETADGGIYAGFRRRFADAEVNVQAAWFRYGMFLDPSLEGYRRLFGNLEGAALMQEVENTVRNIYVADTRYDQEVRKYRDALAADRRSGVKELRPEPQTLEDARNERNTMRKAFLSCFTDHHGIRMDEKKLKAKMKDRTVLIDAWRLVSFADLMVSDGKGGTRFDRTAFRMGDDGVHRAVYNDKGELDEAKSSKDRMMYLAGTAFGVPRTPSYNGGAWLQVVRASFPVRETFDGETWSVGADAVVALDPYTRDEILGCDNDGDESALFMFSPNESGYVPVGDVEQCLPGMDLSTWDHSFASGSALESKKNRSDMLAKASAMNVDGVRYVKRTGDAFEITPAGQRAVSNQLVQGLISMAHDLEVPPGTGRRPFASEISGRTKAQPFDDARWWKRTKDEAPGFEGVTRLMDVMPPDIIEDGQTIGDPELQEKVSLSAKKSAKARAMIVSAAAALHVAYISGCFEGTAESNPFTLFGPGFAPDGWQAFMRHFDGLSNATFDDVKERICARLGLTPEMIDTLVVDLLNMPRPPQTDREWFGALERYVLSVRDRLPDGTPVWKPNLDSSISGEDDKSRMFMAGVSDEYADTWDFLAKNALFGGGGAKGARRDGLLKAFGLMRVTRPDGSIAYTIDLRNAPENSARRELGRFLLSDATLTAGIIEAALERGGRNPVAGYLLWLGGAGCGTLRRFMDGEAEDLGALRTTLQVRGAEFRKFFRRRRAWMKAKDFAHAVNYTQVDPGSPTAYRTVERADKAYADVMAVMYQRLSPDRQKLVLHMRQATRMGYSCGMVNAGTPGARAHEAVTAVQANPRMNSDIVDEFQRMGDIASRDDALAVQEAIVHAAETDGLVDDRDRDMLQDSMTNVPYVIAALQSLPRTGFTKDIGTTRRFLEALAGFDDTPGLRIFGLRNTIESMFRVMYALSATSNEGIDHPGLTFFGMRNDSAFRKSEAARHREGRMVQSNYGMDRIKLPLATVFPTFATRDLASMSRMRRAMAELGHRGSRAGALDTATRTSRNADVDRFFQARSFNLTLDNLSAARREAKSAMKAGGSSRAANALIDAIDTAKAALERVEAAMGLQEGKAAVTVSDMVEKLLPIYSALTTPVHGTPSYEQFSGSLLAMLPGVYPTWSKRQADNDAAYDAMRSKMRSQDVKPVGFVDCLSALRFAPVDHDATANRLRAQGVDANAVPAALDMVANSRPGRIAEPVRQNPENRTLVDIFAYDGVLFKAARLHEAMAASHRGLVAEHPAETGPVTAAEDALPAEERATDQTFARLSESFRTMLSAIPGLNVEVDGNTMVVTGTLSGEQALKRRGIGKPVRTVIRIDLCPAGYGATAADLNSPANAASITNALREAGIVDISPENFLTKLSLAEREALVRRVMPEALAKAGTGYALRTPSWQIDSEGVLTLAGAIKLRKAGGRTAFHEYFHSVVGMMRSLGMFTGGERAALEKAFGKARHEAELFDEEKAADMFADYVMKRRAKAAKGPVASFLERILDFVKRLLAVMQGKGFHYDESLKVGDVQVTGREMLFNMVLSGQVMDSLDSAKIVKTRLDAAHRAQEGLAQDAAMARMDAAMSKTHVDRFEETMKSKAPMDAAKDRLLETRTVQALEMNPVASFQDLLDEAVKRRGGTVASERGGETAQPQLSSLGEASAEVAAQFDAVPPGNGITGESTSGAERLSQMGHALAQAIADGMDAVDPAVRGLLESHSDLSRLHYSSKLADVTTEAVYDVVNHGLFSAAETLGVDLKAKDQLVKNIVYANMILLYDDLAVRLGYGGRKNAIRMAREHKGEAVRRKEFITRHDVAALLLTAGGLSYDDIAKDAYATFAELRAEANGHPDLLRNLAHLERNLRRIVAKTAYKGDPIHEIMAGVKMGERDLETGVEADATEDTGATSRTALRNRRNYMFGDRRFQRAIKAAMRTAYTLAAAKKLYQILGIEESQLKGNVRIPGGFGDRVKVRDRRTGEPVQEPVTNAEVADALGMSINDLLDDRTVFDPFAEVGLYVNNPGEWLASTVRAKFGGKPLRELFTEHGELEAAVKRFHHVQNWWAMYLGENFTEGHRLLRVKKDKGHFIMEDGHVSYDEEGHERIGFDNYHYRALGMDHVHGSTVDVTLDRTDKETIDFWLKAAYFHAMHDRYMLTGIDGVYVTFSDIQKSDGSRWTEADFSADKVLARYNGSHVGRQISKVDMMLAEVLSENQLPSFVKDAADVFNGYRLGLYDRLVKGIVETFNEMQRAYSARGSNLSPALANRMFLEGMAKRGLIKYTVDPKGVPAHGTVAVSVAEIEEYWKNSQAYRKLVKAGRDGKMLTMDAVAASARSAYEECRRIARKNPWMMEGDGRHFNAMGSMMPFFAGGGVFMYYANRIGTDAKKDVSQRLNEYEESFLRTLQSPDGDVTDGQLMMLHDYFRTGTDAGQALRTAIANGEYVEGSAKALKTGLVVAPEDLAHSHRVAETIYRRLCEISWAQERHADLVELSGGRGSVARMLDFYAQTAGEYTGWAAAGMNATQMYELNGVLPANFQIFHAVNVKLQDAARTAQFRNTFVGFLFSSDENGMPIAYAKPSLVGRGYADDGIPEEIWEYAARWWAEANGRQYDEAMSGRANAARLYDEIITANESKTVKGRHFRQLDGQDRAGLTSVSDFAAVDDDASSDDVNSRNALNGGEAYGYAKMLFNVKRVVGGKAQSLLLDRIASFSKTLSVQHSAFFPIATKMESPAAAVGFWTMLASNFAPGTARRLDKAARNFDRLFRTHFSDTINRDFVGFRDILEMMDTNDPFLAEAVNICNALGISLSTRLVNPAEENKAQVEADMARLTDAARGFLGDKGAQFVKGAMEGFLFRGSERAFTYALNATKIATALQIAQVCRRKCREEGRAFNLVREVKPYAAYINAEVGGIDPMRYAWANPRFRKMMSWSMFSWEWTKGAWSAGGGEIIETALGGGHFTTPEMRAQMWGRWLRMYGAIMIGVPMAFQAAIKLLSWCMGGYGGDDDDPWWTWENERKVGMSAFNLTPLLKTISKSETALWLKDKPVVGSLMPAYTGKDHYNTSGNRKYYMHFGKQGWEFFRWFRHPVEQFLNKLSMPTQRIMEGILGYNMASREYDLPMSKHSFAARWLNPFLQTGREGAWFNILTAFVPFSWNAMGTYGDAGALPVLGPVSMGSSYQANIKDAQAALTSWALNEREGYSYGFAKAGKNRKLLAARITYILKDAQRNGMDPKTILTEASGLAAKELYRRLFDLLPKEPGADIDVRAVTKVARGLNRLGVTQSQAMESLRNKFGRRGLDWDLMPAAQRIRVRSIIGETMRNPYTADEGSVEANTARNLQRLGVQAEKGKDY